MRAPEPEERLLEVTRDDGTVTHQIVKVIEEPAAQPGATARSMLRCEEDQVGIILTINKTRISAPDTNGQKPIEGYLAPMKRIQT